MKNLHRIGITGAVMALALTGSALLAPAAHADTSSDVAVHPMTCDPGGGAGTSRLHTSGKKVIYLPSKTRVYGDKGVTITISKSKSWTVGMSYTGTLSTSVSVFVAQASQSLSLSLTASFSSTTTIQGSWTVTQSRGWLEVGTMNGYSWSWYSYHYTGNCTLVKEHSGTAKAPSKSAHQYFHHS